MFFIKKNAMNNLCFLSLHEYMQQFKFEVVMTDHLTLFLTCFFSHFK